MRIKTPTGATPLDSETLQLLIPNLTTQTELNEFEAQNIAEAMLWAANSQSLKKNLISATGIIRLHKKMFDETWQWAGKFRWKQTNIGVSPETIQNELGALLGNVQYWLDNKTYPLEEIAVRFHHKLVWIHPFANGNGRCSRLAADLLLQYNRGQKLNWGSQDLAKESEIRNRYLKALRLADQNDYTPLMKFAKG